jgi:hypothetical protein
MKCHSELLDIVGDTARNKVIDFLIENRGLDFSKTEIAEGAGISRTALFKMWNVFIKEKLVVDTRHIGNITFFKANENSKTIKLFIVIENNILKLNSSRQKLDKLMSWKKQSDIANY